MISFRNSVFNANNVDPDQTRSASEKLLLLPFFIGFRINAISVDPDQMRSASSNLGLHCLPMFLFGDARHELMG